MFRFGKKNDAPLSPEDRAWLKTLRKLRNKNIWAAKKRLGEAASEDNAVRLKAGLEICAGALWASEKAEVACAASRAGAHKTLGVVLDDIEARYGDSYEIARSAEPENIRAIFDAARNEATWDMLYGRKTIRAATSLCGTPVNLASVAVRKNMPHAVTIALDDCKSASADVFSRAYAHAMHAAGDVGVMTGTLEAVLPHASGRAGANEHLAQIASNGLLYVASASGQENKVRLLCSGRTPSGAEFPAADANASGCAALIAAATWNHDPIRDFLIREAGADILKAKNPDGPAPVIEKLKDLTWESKGPAAEVQSFTAWVRLPESKSVVQVRFNAESSPEVTAANTQILRAARATGLLKGPKA